MTVVCIFNFVPSTQSRRPLNHPTSPPTLQGRTKKSYIDIRDDAVSEKHAVIEWIDEQWVITDVGSSNGTTVNSVILEEGNGVPLRSGDVISFGVGGEGEPTSTRIRVSIRYVTSTHGGGHVCWLMTLGS